MSDDVKRCPHCGGTCKTEWNGVNRCPLAFALALAQSSQLIAKQSKQER